jgi:DNA polymerase bacteriophage-type
VQGIARDLLAEAMLRMDIAKLDIVTHTHDECVAEVPKKDIARIKPKFTKLMTTVPEWGKGIPIVATPWVSERYVK